MKYLKTYKLFESRLENDLIYHWTDYRGLISIMLMDEMISHRGYISFSVSEKFNYMLNPIRISFNFDCMKNKYSFEEYNHSSGTIHEEEVRIVKSSIKNIRECITNIEAYTTLYYSSYQDSTFELIKNKFGIDVIKKGDFYKKLEEKMNQI